METGRGKAERRVACLVPGCGRGIGREAWTKRFGGEPGPGAEYLCQTHWKTVPSAMKKVYARLRRRERRFDAALPTASRIWRRIVAHALSDGMGPETLETRS